MKFRILLLEVCGLLLFSMILHGQFKQPPVNTSERPLSGYLLSDLTADTNAESTDATPVKRKVVYKRFYSPLRAALYSAVIPGAGQFYTKNYLKSSLYFGAEVLSWVIYAIYENKGDQRTNDYQNYADERWSVIRYVDWICNYYITDRSAIVPGGQSANVSQPWLYVDWNQLNLKEDSLSKIVGNGFTHRLEEHGKQQYYEMIGKYAQFGGGWDDAGSLTPYDVIHENVSPNFIKYRDMRGDANSAYNIATTVSYIIVANHIFSALEAAWNASRINNRIKLQGHIESRTIYGNLVEFVPTIRFECGL